MLLNEKEYIYKTCDKQLLIRHKSSDFELDGNELVLPL